MAIDISKYLEQLSGELTETAYKASDSLARIGSEDVKKSMIELLNHPSEESRILAARTLGLMEDNADALVNILDAVKDKGNKQISGDLLMALDGFDVSDIYVELFRLYLFGTFKVSTIAKGFLDFKEFEITPRVLKKAEKHWNHYVNNAKQDDVFEIRKAEVDEMFSDLNSFLEE